MADDDAAASRGGTIQLPKSSAGPLRALIVRFGLAVTLLTLMVGLVFIDREGYTDSLDGDVSFIDCFYYATVTLTTTGYGDITPVTDSARLINAIIVTPLRVMFLILLVGTTLEVLASQGRRDFRIAIWRRTLQDHTVVVGYGTKGRAAVETLLTNEIPLEKIVIVDPDPGAVREANDAGLSAVQGDASRSDVLRRARVHRARQVIITAQRDDTAVLVTLTVRRLNPGATVVSSVREQENVALLRQSGADAVITSSEAVGRLLGLSTVSPDLGSVLEDLISYGEGLEVAERRVLPREEGKAPRDLEDVVIAVIRDGTLLRYYEPSVSLLVRGDRIIVIRPAVEQPWAARPGASGEPREED